MDNPFSKKELVYMVYREQSFSKAAQKLYISQPSLSLLIQKIETDVGMPLFDRTCKPVRLTEAGREYIRATEEIQHTERSFNNYVDAVNGLQAGTLAIGSNQLFSSLLLPQYVSEFIRRYPGIRLDLVDDNSAVLESKIMTGQLDLIIDNKRLNPELFEKQNIQTESLLLAVPKPFESNCIVLGHRLSHHDILQNRHRSQEISEVPLSPFSKDPFILMTKDNDTRLRTDEIFRDASFAPNIILEVDRLLTLYNFIQIGIAAAVVSDTLVKNIPYGTDRTWFYKLPEKYALRQVYVHYKRRKYYSKAMESFVGLLTEPTLPSKF